MRIRLRGSASAISSVPSVHAKRHEVVPEHQIDWDGVKQFVVDLAFAKVNVFAAISRASRSPAAASCVGVSLICSAAID